MKKIMPVIILLGSIFTVKAEGPPNFELRNKSGDIWVGIVNGKTWGVYAAGPKKSGAIAGTLQRLGTSNLVQTNINPNAPTWVAIWTSQPKNPRASEALFGRKPTFSPKPQKVYTFTPGRKILVTWDGKRPLRPQTGTLGGLLGKTDSGISLKGNVSSDDIQLK